MLLRFAALSLLFVCGLTAQEFRALLQGTITDPTGAVIPQARVLLRNSATGLERSGAANRTGHYVFQLLPPGDYTLTVRAAGFHTTTHRDIALQTNEHAVIDVALALGESSSTVIVSGDATMLQPGSSALGSVVRMGAIDSLPLKGHSSLLLFNLAVGVVSNRYGEDSRPGNTVQNVLYSVNGSPPASGDVSVDGVSNTVNVNRGTNLSAWVPAMDAVAEFKLQTGTLPAEYGRAAGSIMNIVIKSGTNQLQGSLYGYFKNSALDANLFFPRGAGQQLTPYASTTFGASLDGPVFLPRLYNGHNRTFFFVNYEGLREGTPLSYTSNVPTERMRSGDFSQTTRAIYDPESVHAAGGAPVRTPFPGNVIPYSMQDPVGRAVLEYYPHANVTGPQPSSPWVQTWVYSGKWPRDYNAVVAKLDETQRRQQMFLRINTGSARLVYPRQFDGIATPGGNVVDRPHFGVAFGDTWSLDAHSILDLRIGYTGGHEMDRPWSSGFDLTTLGLPASYAAAAQLRAFPSISVSNFQGLGGSPSIDQAGHTWSLQSSLSLDRGMNLFKVGGEARAIRGNFYRNDAAAGAYNFTTAFSGGPRADTPATTSGFALASLLLGLGNGSISWQQPVAIQNLYYAFYLQHDRRLNRRFMLNLGLRYEYEAPRTERYNRTTRGFAYDTPSPLVIPGMDLSGGLLYAGTGGQPRGIYNPDRDNFAPRVGFAWSISQKMVVRGGASVNFVPVVGSVQPSGWSVNTPWVSSADGITPLDRLSNPFPSGKLAPTGNSLGMTTLLGQPITFIDPSDETPRFYSWQFSVQHELPSRAMCEIAYVGSRSTHIIGGPTDYATSVAEQVNQLDPRYLGMRSTLLEPVANPFYGTIASGPLSYPTVPRQQLLRPYPQFTDILRQYPALGNSVYHSMQFRFEKRLKSGVRATLGYTISKNINDIAGGQDAYNRRAERALSEFDVPQRLTFTASWDLPFLSQHRLLGGWQISTFNTFQSGFPLAFTLSQPNIYAAGAQQRPNVTGDVQQGISGSIDSRLNRYFNTAAFSQPADFTFGDIGPRIGSVRSPGMNNWNVRLGKEFRLSERRRVAFRVSSFNLLNHPVFAAPNTNFGGSSFGRVFNQANLSRQMEIAAKLLF
jgi:hypothetical protein